MNLNFHRAPGYCVNPPTEPLDLWNDPKAHELAASHWRHFAERYRGIPSREQIRAHLSGNYCRCTGYHAIVDAVEAVAQARSGAKR